ncbi:MAG: Rieske 2Fe-2S domain-containing protein [Chloroflexi bacterium]|nr:Rieske 2Fe-2S domain-containing protein [Chloroflexota bacterium]OJV95945.1 MAG: hypothetical protein BGO39_03675 [Chloroflexi bacterium 54-19]
MLSTATITTYRKDHPRLTNHYGLALFSLLGCIVAGFVGGPNQSFMETVSLGTGYVALLLVLLTLAIGPINMLKKRKNPVNVMFRRDAGIWAGITAIVHMVSSLLLYFGGNLLLYFFEQTGAGLTFSFDLFYLSDYLGLVAGLVILFLLVLSNNYFLKKFKGPKWKQFQRFNYLLFVVALLHTFGQEITNNRNPLITFGVIALAAFVVVAQSIGFVVYRRRDQQRKAASSGPAPARASVARPKTEVVSAPGAIPAPAMGGFMPLQPAYAAATIDKGLGRRRFLLMTGTVLLSGAVGGLSAKVLAKNGGTVTTTASNTTGVIATTAATATSASSGTSAATATTAGSTATTGATTTTAATTAASNTAASTTAAASTGAATTATTSGTVLATIANLAAGKAIAVTTPDTRAAAFVIHRQDGSVACFSGICTHEPVSLTFDESQQTLYCPKHGVPFNTQTGAPERGPARTALTQYKVTVDSQGQVIYG